LVSLLFSGPIPRSLSGHRGDPRSRLARCVASDRSRTQKRACGVPRWHVPSGTNASSAPVSSDARRCRTSSLGIRDITSRRATSLARGWRGRGGSSCGLRSRRDERRPRARRSRASTGYGIFEARRVQHAANKSHNRRSYCATIFSHRAGDEAAHDETAGCDPHPQAHADTDATCDAPAADESTTGRIWCKRGRVRELQDGGPDAASCSKQRLRCGHFPDREGVPGSNAAFGDAKTGRVRDDGPPGNSTSGAAGRFSSSIRTVRPSMAAL